jgi:hypothetical protein
MQFFLFLDDVGAEFAWARINRREIMSAVSTNGTDLRL